MRILPLVGLTTPGWSAGSTDWEHPVTRRLSTIVMVSAHIIATEARFVICRLDLIITMT